MQIISHVSSFKYVNTVLNSQTFDSFRTHFRFRHFTTKHESKEHSCSTLKTTRLASTTACVIVTCQQYSSSQTIRHSVHLQCNQPGKYTPHSLVSTIQTMISKRYDHLLRLLLIGETGVGKTCLLCRFANNDFVESHISTIGIDFKMKTMDLDGQTVKVQIWDTAGQERFEAITKQFYRRAQGVMLVFDICNRRSYESIPRWLDYVKQFCKESVSITLIGNKSDKHDRRQVPFMEAQTFADNHNINFFEVSAKDRNNIDKPFLDMCREILHTVEREGEPERENTSILIDSQAGTQQNVQGASNSVTQDPTPLDGGTDQSGWCCTIS